jgi:dTDP-glucose 4,6-dehydratase
MADGMNWANRRVLVTGAGGFIGSHLAERLVREGAKVRAMVHYNALGDIGWLADGPLAEKGAAEIFAGDVTDRDSVRRAMGDIEVAFHLAALIAIPYSYRAPASYVRTNVEGTLNILQAAREVGTARVVHTSTSEVYGSALAVPIAETHPLQGQSPYSASKIGADKMAEAFHRSYGVPVVTVRPFNTFGPRQSARAVIPTAICQLLKGEALRLGSLHPTRDFNFVENTVDGFLAAAATDAAVGRVVSFGSGREIGVGDLVALLGQMIGREPKIETEPDRVRPGGSEVERLLADNTLARDLLGWAPAVTLEEGLGRTIEWFRANAHRYRADEFVV